MVPKDVTTLRLREDVAFEAAARPCLAAARRALMTWADVVSSGRLEALLGDCQLILMRANSA